MSDISDNELKLNCIICISQDELCTAEWIWIKAESCLREHVADATGPCLVSLVTIIMCLHTYCVWSYLDYFNQEFLSHYTSCQLNKSHSHFTCEVYHPTYLTLSPWYLMILASRSHILSWCSSHRYAEARMLWIVDIDLLYALILLWLKLQRILFRADGDHDDPEYSTNTDGAFMHKNCKEKWEYYVSFFCSIANTQENIERVLLFQSYFSHNWIQSGKIFSSATPQL